ncbi:MAG TPA: DUF5947 family protein [Acidimicrobiales bacterium]|nr:DUF5947 family protein [Acidimicrobiales bacterium]
MSEPSPLEVLERFRRPRPRPGERCELCAAEIGGAHAHVVSVSSRSLMCACRPCYLLFLPGGAGGGHYKAVPDRVVALGPSAVSRATWEELQIPVGIAFFFHSTLTGQVHGFYPGPAGATESLLPLDLWERLLRSDPVLAALEADVEALLVRAGPDGDPESYVVPIDACYELVGYLRMQWRGFDGGSEARRTIDEFFAGVAQRAR